VRAVAECRTKIDAAVGHPGRGRLPGSRPRPDARRGSEGGRRLRWIRILLQWMGSLRVSRIRPDNPPARLEELVQFVRSQGRGPGEVGVRLLVVATLGMESAAGDPEAGVLRPQIDGGLVFGFGLLDLAELDKSPGPHQAQPGVLLRRRAFDQRLGFPKEDLEVRPVLPPRL